MKNLTGDLVTRNYYADNLQVGQSVGSTSYYYLTDLLGSIRFVTTSTGSITFSSDYKPFGEQYNPSGSDSFFMYTGKYYDSLTGLYYYNARFYDPAIQRFISEDSYSGQSDQPQTQNRYSYAQNNPETYTDLTGHWIWFGGWLEYYQTYELANYIVNMIGYIIGIAYWVLATVLGGWWKTISVVMAVLDEGFNSWAIGNDLGTIFAGVNSWNMWEWGDAIADLIKQILFGILVNVSWWEYLELIGAYAAQGLINSLSFGAAIAVQAFGAFYTTLIFFTTEYSAWLNWGQWQ